MPIRTDDTYRYKCEHCDKMFNYKNRLSIHLLKHSTDRPYKCEVCEKSFVYKNVLVDHRRRHTGERPYKCKLCPKSFTTSSNLTVHTRTHTGERLYKCDRCPKYFSQNQNLIVHIRTHTGERPYQCEKCSRTFANPSSLKRHYLIHTGKRPHKCEQCLKSFVRSADLQVHRRSHTGERPYKCDFCPKSYTLRGNLAKHSRIHSAGRLFNLKRFEHFDGNQVNGKDIDQKISFEGNEKKYIDDDHEEPEIIYLRIYPKSLKNANDSNPTDSKLLNASDNSSPRQQKFKNIVSSVIFSISNNIIKPYIIQTDEIIEVSKESQTPIKLKNADNTSKIERLADSSSDTIASQKITEPQQPTAQLQKKPSTSVDLPEQLQEQSSEPKSNSSMPMQFNDSCENAAGTIKSIFINGYENKENYFFTTNSHYPGCTLNFEENTWQSLVNNNCRITEEKLYTEIEPLITSMHVTADYIDDEFKDHWIYKLILL